MFVALAAFLLDCAVFAAGVAAVAETVSSPLHVRPFAVGAAFCTSMRFSLLVRLPSLRRPPLAAGVGSAALAALLCACAVLAAGTAAVVETVSSALLV